MWCREFAPETFWVQTAQTYAAALRGKASARRDQAERDLTLAYWTGAFSRAGKDIRSLRYYLDQLRRDQPGTEKIEHARAIAFFHGMKARGVPIAITRMN